MVRRESQVEAYENIYIYTDFVLFKKDDVRYIDTETSTRNRLC